MNRLPAIKPDKLDFNWFPTRMQCFIYRNWGIVSESKMAEILNTDRVTVHTLACDMGLPPVEMSAETWNERGYITIIRANWHLLPYEQICRLLGWDTEKLAFILAEDDFLGEKLGGFKPYAAPLHYYPLSDGEKEKTKRLKEITESCLSCLPEIKRMPFDFSIPAEGGYKPEEKRFGEVICYSYCAVYGDLFSDIELIDKSYPDELLKAYSDRGITGIWTQAVLYKLAEFPFDPDISRGYRDRITGLNYLTGKLKKFGLKLFLYLNEPRALSLDFFEKHPELMGITENGTSSLCVSVKKVQEYIFDSVYGLVSSVVGLGGIITITASENLTNCHSHADRNPDVCKKCAGRTPAEEFALVNSLIYQGAKRANPDIEVIAWNWGWPEKDIDECIAKLPEGISVMSVSEQGCVKNFGDIETKVLDYSISVDGPGEYAAHTWSLSNKLGHKAYAKIQANNSWEMSAVPYIPAFEKIYAHINRIAKRPDVDGIMTGWTLGGYPSPAFSIIGRFCEKNKTLPTLDECCEIAFPGLDVRVLKKAFHHFSEAFDMFPFSLDVIYKGPQQLGPANLLFAQKTGFSATMVGYPYDDIKGWTAIFPEEIFIEQMRQLSEEWSKGITELRQLLPGGGRQVKQLFACAETCYNHFRSVYLQTLFYHKRDSTGQIDGDILDEEKKIALSQAAILSENAEIGYEPSNHYYYTRYMLLEKIICCDYLKEYCRGAGDFSPYRG